MRPFLPLVVVVLAWSFHQPARGASWFHPKARTAERAQGDTLYKDAFAAYESGDYARAHDLLNQAEKLKPDQADGWNLRGAIFLRQGAYDKAEAAFGRAAALDPDLWAARFNQAEAAYKAKNYAVARGRFDNLASQTNRFKAKEQWELAQYKAFLSSLLMNDAAGTQKRFAKLPATGGVTPAYAYAQAATAYLRNDAAGAQKALAQAQNAYSPALNGLFSDSLVAAGWQAAPPMLPAANTALAAAEPMATLPPGSARPQAPYVIDPKIESAAAEPLPASGPAGESNRAGTQAILPPVNASPAESLLQPPLVTDVKKPSSPAPEPTPTPSALDRGMLLD